MNFSDNLVQNDLWTHLASTSKTVVMYGMGNGADKILAVCDRYNIEIADFFASDGFVRGHSFHGKTVLSYSEVKKKYGAENMIVLISFGSSLPDVLSLFKRVNDECETYAPDVPVCDGELFTYEFFTKNKEKIEKVYSLLADETSKSIYKNVINYKLSGKLDYLFAAETDKCESYSLLDAKNFRSAADLGAYNGDTVRELLEYSPDIERIFAFEPDKRNFKKLNQFCDQSTSKADLIALNAAAWECDTTLTFGGEGNRNSGVFAPRKTARSVEVEARSLDSVLSGTRVDYIKYDVEGAEREAIEGSRGTILSHRPALLVSAYHKSEDIFALPLQIHDLRPDYKLYYRRYPYVPAWDLNLICI
ncbi:MAG: FkbM family methyltransferase [Ruminococcaceae bacterium]|nr:FkbM family methyltransferase [Oscillospiraceae bacterium]